MELGPDQRHVEVLLTEMGLTDGEVKEAVTPRVKRSEDQVVDGASISITETCRQNIHSHDTFGHVQLITARTAQMFHSRREHAWLKGQHGSELRTVVSPKRFRHPSVMSHMLPHLSLNTSTRSLSLASLVFRPSSPSLSCPTSAPSGLDQETLRDPWRSGGYTKSASPTGHEPKLIQSDDFEPQEIELDRNLGTDLQPGRIELDLNLRTDPHQISVFDEIILGDDYQNPVTEDTEETGHFGVGMPYVQSRIHSDYDSAESIADSDLEDGELRKMLASPLHVHGRGENYGSSPKPTASGKPEAKIMQKRGASAQRTQADQSGRESLKSNSSQEPRASGKPDAVFSSRSDEPGH